jgi:hypothetical protein
MERHLFGSLKYELGEDIMLLASLRRVLRTPNCHFRQQSQPDLCFWVLIVLMQILTLI